MKQVALDYHALPKLGKITIEITKSVEIMLNLSLAIAKRFAIDIEVESESRQAFMGTVKRTSCAFCGINLEDIKAPECFDIEGRLIEDCDIPVFHLSSGYTGCPRFTH